MTKINHIVILFAISLVPLMFWASSLARAAGNIDSADKYAWSDKSGWINFNPTNFGGVSVYSDHLEGYAWAENIGWVRLGTHTGGSPHTYANSTNSDYGVNHDGTGNLSGYAWSNSAGWINFDPADGFADGIDYRVTIDLATGAFDGYAWCESVGWIHFKNDAPAYNVAIDLTKPADVDSLAVNGIYKKGDTIPIDVIFNRTVTVDGTPQLTLETGDDDAVVDFASGNGSDSLTFDYTVAGGQKSDRLDYRTSASLVADGATLTDPYGLDVILPLPTPGSPGSLSVNKNIAIDGVAPPAPKLTPVATPTTDNTPTWTWASDAGGDGIAIFRYLLDETLVESETASATFTPTISLEDGEHTFEVQERDAAGNWSGPAEGKIWIDATAPSITGLNHIDGPVRTASWTWSSDDPDADYRYVIDQQPDTVPTTPFADIASARKGGADGLYYLHVQARDPLGNISGVATVQALLDNTPPTLSGLQNDDAVSQSKTWAWTADEPAQYKQFISIEPTLEKFPEFVIYEDARTATLTDADGKWYIHVQARDEAGNESDIVSVYAMMDDAAAIIKGLNDDATPRKSKTWTWYSDMPGVTFRHLIDQNPTSVPTGDFNSITTATKPGGDGIWYLHVQARDAQGLNSPVKTVYAVLDNTPPVVEGLSDDDTPRRIKYWEWTADETAEFRFAADQDAAGMPSGDYADTTEYRLEGVDGTWRLHVQAQDAAGNESAVVTVSAELNSSADPVPYLTAQTPTRNTTPTWTWRTGGGRRYYRARLHDEHFVEADNTTAEEFTPTEAFDEGVYTLYVQEMDLAGKFWSESASLAVEVDRTPPETVDIIDPPSGLTNADAEELTVAGEDVVAYRYNLDRAIVYSEERDIDTPIVLRDLKDAPHLLSVIGRDAAGNWQTPESGAEIRWTVDTDPPEVVGLSDAPDPVQSIGWTWEADEPAMFRSAVDRHPDWPEPVGDFTAAASADQTGGDGTYYLHVQARDAAGNIGPVTTVSALLDNTPPVIDPIPDSDEPARTHVWTWSETDANGGITYRYRIDQDETGEPSGDYRDVTEAGKLEGDGTWRLHVQARDAAGNESAVVSAYAVLDNTPPVILGLFSDPFPVQSRTWTWSAGEGDLFRYTIDQDSFGTPTGDYADVRQAGKTDGDGLWYLHVQGKDPLGNVGTVTTVYTVLDNTPPGTPRVSGDSPTNDDTPQWEWAPSTGDGVMTWRYRLDDPDMTSGTTETLSQTFTPTVPLENGAHTLYVQQRDVVGNWSAPGSREIVVDTDAAPPPSVSGPGYANTGTVRFTWGSGGGVGVYRYRLDAEAWSTETGQTETEISVPERAHDFCVQEQDDAGNWSAAGCAKVTVDLGRPCSRAAAPPTLYDQLMSGALRVSYEIQDRFDGETCGGGATGSGVAEVALYVKRPGTPEYERAATDAGDAVDGGFDFQATDRGTYYFYTLAADRAGNAEVWNGIEEARTLYSSDFAGYAILAVGSVATEEGLEAHTKTAASVYRRLKDRNFLDHAGANHWTDPLDHIKFFTPYDDAPVAGRDDHTRNPTGGFPIEYGHALEYAVTTWAADRMAEIPGPLYLVLLDHGANDMFFLNGFSQVSAARLNNWLTTLEDALPVDYAHPIVVVIGTCYAGSFIDNLAKPGRIIVTSTAPDEVSYRGPLTPGQYRDGEFFITALFNELGLGDTLYDSYRKAVELTEMHTDSGRSSIRAPYFDTANQHPYIEADGLHGDDGLFGVHDIGYRGDADMAKTIVMGYGAEIVPLVVARTGRETAAMPETVHTNRFWAEIDGDVDDPKQVKVWVEIRKPDQLLEGAAAGQVTSLTVDLTDVELSWNPDNGRYEAAYGGFWDSGKYTLFFYAMDAEGNISHPARTYVYKSIGPTPPGDVNGSGTVDLADAALALKVAAGVDTADAVVLTAADVNGDAAVGLAEAAFALRKVAQNR